VRTNQGAHSHKHSHWSYYSFPSPLLGKSLTCGIPLRDSWELIQWDCTWQRTDFPPQGLLSPDEIARQIGPLLFGVQLGQDYSKGWNCGAKEDPEYHWVAHHLVLSWVPPYSSADQPLASGSRGQNGWYLAGASRSVVEILPDEKLSNTQRSRNTHSFTLFYFTLAVPDELVLKILIPQQWNHRILKGLCNRSGYRECAGF
jgi:hypothetical protein